MNPLSLLKALPLKDYLYLGAIAVIVTGFAVYTSHERGIGAAKVVAQDAKLAAAQEQHIKDVNALAAARTTKTGDTYVATIAAPAPAGPRILCKRPTAASPGVLPEAAGNTGLSVSVANGAETDKLDIGPPLRTTGRNADALIIALQDEVRTLVDAMNGKTAP